MGVLRGCYAVVLVYLREGGIVSEGGVINRHDF